MPSYEQKLDEFARGKSLVRLARTVRDRADARCDACGSTQPRTLHSLKDVASDRYYFVGESCFKGLADRGIILRRFGREAAHEAFKIEMERRALEMDKGMTAPEPGSNSQHEEATVSESLDASSDLLSDTCPLFPSAVVVEADEHYQAFVSILSAQGTICAWGYAREFRYQEAWQKRWDGGMLLEKVSQERPNALGLCLNRAWHDAWSRFEGSKRPTPPAHGSDGHIEGRSLPNLLTALLNLGGTSRVSHQFSPSRDNGHQGPSQLISLDKHNL
ncbi:MAG: hypothetical protein V3U31_07005 [Dehalococcoidia bacterium]